MNDRRIDVLVVDDSGVMRMLLVHLLEGDPRLRVVAAVADGEQALEFVQRTPPGVVLMDIHMEGMDGFEVTRRIMETRPVPIVLCSAISAPSEVATAFRAMEAGAVALVEKPVSTSHPAYARVANELLQTVALMSEVKVVRRWARRGAAGHGTAAPQAVAPPRGSRIRLVGVGASTGGPQALQVLLGGLPADFAIPVLIVQHITAGFLPGLAEWLMQTSGFRVQIAGSGMEPLAGHVYLAPDDYHMGIAPDGRIRLTREPAEHGLRPAVDHLFRSLARECAPGAIGVLLTGMGRDGAEQLKALRDAGGVALVQDRESSVIHGMPGAAIALDAATAVLPLDRMAASICEAVQQRNGEGKHRG